jgi:hypothetical protein
VRQKKSCTKPCISSSLFIRVLHKRVPIKKQDLAETVTFRLGKTGNARPRVRRKLHTAHRYGPRRRSPSLDAPKKPQGTVVTELVMSMRRTQGLADGDAPPRRASAFRPPTWSRGKVPGWGRRGRRECREAALPSLSPPPQGRVFLVTAREGRHGLDYAISLARLEQRWYWIFEEHHWRRWKVLSLRILFIRINWTVNCACMHRNFNLPMVNARACACSPAWNLPVRPLSPVWDLCNWMSQLNIKSHCVQIQ